MIFLVKKNIKRLAASVNAVTSKGRARKEGMRILMYHSVGGSVRDHRLAVRVPLDKFVSQIKMLSGSGYKTLGISEVIEGSPGSFSQNRIAITFDDGFKDNIEAAELLKKHGMKATFFVTVSYINGDVRKSWSGGRPREYMEWADVAMLKDMGFEIGSHMVHHTDLAALSDEDMASELTRSKETISQRAGTAVKVFSYPYGGINKKVIEKAAGAGYIGGCFSFGGFNNASTNPYVLRRTEIDGYDTTADFKNKIAGFYDFRSYPY